LIDHLSVCALLDPVDFAALRRIDQIEQRRKSIAQIETAAASVANLEDPLEFRIERLQVIKLRIPPVERMARWRLETTLAARLDL
jgi:hypothetical protein